MSVSVLLLGWTIVLTPWLQSVWDLRLVPGMVEAAEDDGRVAA